MQHPIGVRLLLLLGFLVGLAPFSLRSILGGRPEFVWCSMGVIMAGLNLIGEGFVCYTMLITRPTNNNQSSNDEAKVKSTSTDRIANDLQMMTAHIGYILAVLVLLKEGKEVAKTFDIASRLATAAAKVGSQTAPCKSWLEMLTGIPQCLWMVCAGSLVAFGTLGNRNIWWPSGWKFFALLMLCGKTLGAVFFVCSTIWYFSDCAKDSFATLLTRSAHLLSQFGDDEDEKESHAPLQDLYVDNRAALVNQEVPSLHKVYTLAGKLCDQFSQSHGHLILVNCSAHLIIMTIHMYFFISLVPGLIQEGLTSSNGSRPSNGVLISLCTCVLAIRTASLTIGCITGHRVISQDEEFRAAMKDVLLEDIGTSPGQMIEDSLLAKRNGDPKATWANKVLHSHELPQNIIGKRNTEQLTSRIPPALFFKRYSMKTRQLLKDTRGLTIHASGYYSLEKGTVVAIVNAIATYVIILIQFRQADPPEADGKAA